MLKKLKNWIIKKLGGYTATEYGALQIEACTVNKVHNIAVINSEVKTFQCRFSLPGYLKMLNFEVEKYAVAQLADSIIDSGAIRVTEFHNPALGTDELIATMKVVI